MGFEFDVLHMIQCLRNETLDAVMTFISFIGNNGAIWIVIGLVMTAFGKYRKCGISILIALIFCLVAGNGILKNLIARERPCWIDESVKLIIAVPRDFSFPSGHTFSSFAGASCILYFHKKEGVFALILAILIAFSRLYLFVHFPSDILGGIALGLIASAFGIYLTKKIYKKNER